MAYGEKWGLGLLGITVGEGVARHGYLAQVIAIEIRELQHGVATARTVLRESIFRNGTEAQKQKYLPKSAPRWRLGMEPGSVRRRHCSSKMKRGDTHASTMGQTLTPTDLREDRPRRFPWNHSVYC